MAAITSCGVGSWHGTSPGRPISFHILLTWRRLDETYPSSLARLPDRDRRPCEPETGLGAVDCVRSEQLRTECSDGCSRLAADQQPDRIATESGADADQPGEESRDVAVLVAVATGTVDPANAAASRASPTHRLRHTADRSGILDHLCAGFVKSFGPGVDRECTNPLAERNGRSAGRDADTGHSRRQPRYEPHPDVGAGDLEPRRDRRVAGEPGRQSTFGSASPATRGSYGSRRRPWACAKPRVRPACSCS